MKLILTGLCTLMLALGSANGQELQAPLWLRYPAISPDGSTIVFAYKGNLYRVATEGGQAQVLTTHAAHDYRPVWSHDGKKIAFASDRYGNFDVFVMPATGGQPTRLTHHSANEYPCSFSIDNSQVLFTAHLQDAPQNILFPSRWLTELYAVPATGGRTQQLLTTPAEWVSLSPNGQFMAYADVKGMEDIWRKHHTSSITHDVWIYNTQTGKHQKLSQFEGEDLNPVFAPDGQNVYYLTERNGSLNVAMQRADNPNAEPLILTQFKQHPVRFLSVAQNGTLCFAYNGELYTMRPNDEPRKINISIASDQTELEVQRTIAQSGASEMVISPDGKETAFIIGGDIYVTSTEYPSTKRITCTPEQERSVSFSPDGKKLLYAAERNGSWNIYQTSIMNSDEPNFSLSTLLHEEPLVEISEEAFQPLYSPNGKEVAFLKERTELCIINIDTKKIRTVLAPHHNYSYSDGDQWFQWSPDSKWLLAQYFEYPSWPCSEVALISADGSAPVRNLTQSGYDDANPKWAMNGKCIIWFSDKMGMRSHGSWGAQFDVWAMFLTQDAYDEFRLTKHEWTLLQEQRKNEKKDDKNRTDKAEDKKDKKTQPAADKSNTVKPLQFDFENIADRRVRLTINSSSLSDAVLTSNGEKLFYLSRFERGFDLWVHNLKERETKLLVKLDGHAHNLQFDKDEKNLYLLSKGSIKKIEVASGKQKPVTFSAERIVNRPLEREHLFEHMWRQVLKKFYDPNIHGVDWAYYKKEYARFLPHINNNYDFAEMASELLGELNASHTGCRFTPANKNADNTASLGVLYDFKHTGNGVRIAEVLDKSPLAKANTKVKTGVIIEKIDGQEITTTTDHFALLNHKAGQLTMLHLYDPASGQRWTETIRPITQAEESDLLYARFVRRNTQKVEELSGGRIGYVHVRGMDSQSFRDVYSDLLGKHRNKEAVVVDTRFNGGGWLHDDLATLLSGKRYADFTPRGQFVNSEPIAKWHKPSALLIGEGNYSDAHGFPYTYRTLGIGPLIGMPIPGTMTAVWWEQLIDPTLVFGIPQMGVRNLNGQYLENQQLQPDIKVAISPEDAATGNDTQLAKAVEVLLKQIQK
ncbi:MAG: PD40 domain-containing protein [Bacteroidales bacterium]|nr:PD40 domain-containing protein [Bacteroidales bacterium]